jgi:BirA family biotin operon repressor/biotin-[acetyl-CoA-carboxylase] ligase
VTAAQTPAFSRREHFARTNSTNDVVGQWLADGEPEICVATADVQTAGRGRDGRTWESSAGTSLLASLGFRPVWLAPEHVWRLAAVVALAMAEAAEDLAGLAPGAIRLKWPNDLVIESAPETARPATDDKAEPAATSSVRKIAGVLGETVGLGTDDARAVIGIGMNVDWRREDFPPDLAAAMTSLRDASGGRAVDRADLLAAFLDRVETGVADLREAQFAASDWSDRQITSGRVIDLVAPDERRVTVRGLGVDPVSGGLVVEEEGRERVVHSGEVFHVRLAPAEPLRDRSVARAPAEVGV